MFIQQRIPRPNENIFKKRNLLNWNLRNENFKMYDYRLDGLLESTVNMCITAVTK